MNEREREYYLSRINSLKNRKKNLLFFIRLKKVLKPLKELLLKHLCQRPLPLYSGDF